TLAALPCMSLNPIRSIHSLSSRFALRYLRGPAAAGSLDPLARFRTPCPEFAILAVVARKHSAQFRNRIESGSQEQAPCRETEKPPRHSCAAAALDSFLLLTSY